MSDSIRVFTGIIMIIVGLLIMTVPFFFIGMQVSGFISWIYGLPILIIGIFILFNKHEDEIEKIRK